MWGFRSRSSATGLVVTDGDDGATSNFPLVAANLFAARSVPSAMRIRRLAAGAALIAALLASPANAQNPVAAENARPGTSDWDFTPTPGGVVEGYSSEESAQPGGTFHLHVKAGNPGDRYRVTVYRLGWYGGSGGRLVTCLPSCAGDEP